MLIGDSGGPGRSRRDLLVTGGNLGTSSLTGQSDAGSEAGLFLYSVFI